MTSVDPTLTILVEAHAVGSMSSMNPLIFNGLVG
jgi:hypothetical protein